MWSSIVFNFQDLEDVTSKTVLATQVYASATAKLLCFVELAVYCTSETH